MTPGTDSSSLPIGVPKRIWIIVAVVTVFAVNVGLTFGNGKLFPGLGMRSQVELANVVIENPDRLTRGTTTMVSTLSLNGELTNNSRDEIWQIEFEVAFYDCPKAGGESPDDCRLAKDVSVLAAVTVPPGKTRSFEATGYLSSKDLPICDNVRWTTKVEQVLTH